VRNPCGVTFSRRSFLRASAAAAGVAAAGPLKAMEAMATPLGAGTPLLLGPGASAPFEHVVVVMMENRTFDHLLGWLPGADGVQEGLIYADADGNRYETFPLAEVNPDFQGCGDDDPDHSWVGGRTQLNGGRNDGFLKTAPVGDQLSIGYYRQQDVGIRADLATSFTVFDRYFSSILAETFPNRFYQHSARTDRLRNTGTTNVADPAGYETIWDRLKAKGIEGRYYFSDLPFLALWGQKYVDIMRPAASFKADALAGNLPAVTFVDPAFLGEGQGASNDDHPRGDIRGGAGFIEEIYWAVRNSPQWDKTVLVINYDEWGGFYDHVVPPSLPWGGTQPEQITIGEAAPAGFDFGQLGFRVPCIVASPFAPAQVWHEGPYDHTSVLKMIEWRWGLDPLTDRDANARNLAEALDLTSPVPPGLTKLPLLTPPVPFQSQPCGPQSVSYAPQTPVNDPAVPDVPWAAALPVAGAAVGAGLLWRRRERIAVTAPVDLGDD
jgi:phospholipase C